VSGYSSLFLATRFTAHRKRVGPKPRRHDDGQACGAQTRCLSSPPCSSCAYESSSSVSAGSIPSTAQIASNFIIRSLSGSVSHERIHLPAVACQLIDLILPVTVVSGYTLSIAEAASAFWSLFLFQASSWRSFCSWSR
jgi:hypothetical protein